MDKITELRKAQGIIFKVMIDTSTSKELFLAMNEAFNRLTNVLHAINESERKVS